MVFAIHLIYRDVALAIDLLSWGLPPLTLALGVGMRRKRLENLRFYARCSPSCLVWLTASLCFSWFPHL